MKEKYIVYGGSTDSGFFNMKDAERQAKIEANDLVEDIYILQAIKIVSPTVSFTIKDID